MRKILALGAIAVLTAIIVMTGCTARTNTTPASNTGTLQVLVRDSAGNPLSGAKVVSNTQPEGQLKVTGLTDQDGRVVFNGLAAGEYQFYVSCFDYVQKEFGVKIIAAQTTKTTINLEVSSPSLSPSPDPTITSPPVKIMWQPTPSTPIHWQWQIGALFNPFTDLIPGVTVYDIDWEQNDTSVVSALHDKGFIVIAYLEAGDWTSGRADASQFPDSVIGRTIPGWSDKWLDIRSPIVRALMSARLDAIKAKGFDAVEPDCIDGYSNRTGFPLTAQDQINYNKWIADQCHQRGLSVGLKNDIEQAAELQPYFDWCLNEESYQYGEYSRLLVFVNNNKAVFEVEYGTTAPQASTMNSLHINSMTRDLDLVSPESSGYVRIPCIPDTQNIWPK